MGYGLVQRILPQWFVLLQVRRDELLCHNKIDWEWTDCPTNFF